MKAYSTDGGWLTWSEDDLVRDACADAGVTARITAEPGRSIAAAAAITAFVPETFLKTWGEGTLEEMCVMIITAVSDRL